MLCAIFSIIRGYFLGSGTNNTRIASSLYSAIPKSIKQIFFYMTSGLRYRLHYHAKTRQRIRVEKMFELRTWNTKHESNKLGARTTTLSLGTHLQQFGLLSNYDLLMMVIRNVHFVDVINLSLASKSLREALLPGAGLAARSEALRTYTCEDGTKSRCWICDIQICRVRQY